MPLKFELRHKHALSVFQN